MSTEVLSWGLSLAPAGLVLCAMWRIMRVSAWLHSADAHHAERAE